LSLDLDRQGFFGLIPMFFIGDNRSHYYCITQTTVERHYFNVMKNGTTSNFAETWVTKTVNHNSIYLDHRQSPAYQSKTCERMLHHRAVYWDDYAGVCILRTIWYSQRAARRKELDRQFMLIRNKTATWSWPSDGFFL